MATTASYGTDKSAKAKMSQPHSHSDKLEDQAATAALYATNKDGKAKGKGKQRQDGHDFLDEDHKLSSAGAAASLKYANAHDLPGFPTVGVKSSTSAAGKAASLGWNNQKPIERWAPEASPAAATAAMLAKDYKMNPQWQPEASSDGAKAALLAHRGDNKVEIWKPEPTAWGNKAAKLAAKKSDTSSQDLGYIITKHPRQGSLIAATSAVSNRRRADSTPAPPKPETYPDEANASTNALNAATSAVSRKRDSKMPVGGSTPYTALSAAMYTSHPPVSPEVEESNREGVLRASAVAMAKKMYNLQEQRKEKDSDAHLGAAYAHRRTRSSFSTTSDDVEPMKLNNLQEAAQKLAQERLAKLHNENMSNREYLDYYGSQAPAGRRLTLRGRAKRRSSSLDADRAQSEKIRAQMTLFSSNLSQIDQKKRAADREALIAAAQRNVNKQMHGLDEQVFAQTGKVGPSLLEEWERKAHTAAQAKSEARMENYGKVDIGGGKFMNQSEVDAVAARNVQPVLDEINEKTEMNREKEATQKLEREANAKRAADLKARDKDAKAIHKKLAQQDKEEEKMRKADEKAALAEEKRRSKEHRKSGHKPGLLAGITPVKAAESLAIETEEAPPVSNEETSTPAAAPVEHEVEEPTQKEAPATTSEPQTTSTASGTDIRTSMEDQASLRMRENAAAAAANDGVAAPLSPTSAAEGGRVKSWIKKRFSLRGSKSQPKHDDVTAKEESFVGGTALTGETSDTKRTSTAPTSEQHAATGAETEGPDMPSVTKVPTYVPSDSDLSDDAAVNRGRTSKRVVDDDREVSPVSNDGEAFQEARDGFNEDLAPPPTFPADKNSSPARDSKFRESFEEM